MKIILWLRSPIATLLVLCSALVAQLPHAADVFRLIVMGTGWSAVLHSYTYAVALELAVLLFVVQRRNVESYLFAFVSILVNLSYYHLHGVHLWTVEAAPAWLISIALPAAIAQYSHLIAAATAQPDTIADSTHAHVKAPGVHTSVQPAPVHAVAPQPAPVAALDVVHAATDDVQPDVQPDVQQPDKRTRALQLRDDGYNASEIARMLDANRNTVQSWLKRSAVQVNGGTQ